MTEPHQPDLGDVGYLDRAMNRPEAQADTIIGRLSKEQRDRVATATTLLEQYLAMDPHVVEAVDLVLGELDRVTLIQLGGKLTHEESEYIRGRRDGLEVAKEALTNARLLAQMRRDMLGPSFED